MVTKPRLFLFYTLILLNYNFFGTCIEWPWVAVARAQTSAEIIIIIYLLITPMKVSLPQKFYPAIFYVCNTICGRGHLPVRALDGHRYRVRALDGHRYRDRAYRVHHVHASAYCSKGCRYGR